MDLTTTIIGAAILVLCIVPLVMAHNKKKNREQKLLRALTEHAASHSCSITRQDLWQNTAIGLDGNANCLFFVRSDNNGGKTLHQARLAGIRQVYVNGDADPGAAEKLELVLVHASANEPDTVLEFYNQEASLQINEELQMIKKWEEIVQNGILK